MFVRAAVRVNPAGHTTGWALCVLPFGRAGVNRTTPTPINIHEETQLVANEITCDLSIK